MINFLVFFLLFLVSCTPFDREPELKDPNYTSVLAEVASLEGQSTSKIEECKNIYKEAESSEPQTGLRASLLEKWKVCTDQQDQILQKLKHSKVSLETHRVRAAKEYSESLKNGEIWPKPPKSDVPRGTSD